MRRGREGSKERREEGGRTGRWTEKKRECFGSEDGGRGRRQERERKWLGSEEKLRSKKMKEFVPLKVSYHGQKEQSVDCYESTCIKGQNHNA